MTEKRPDNPDWNEELPEAPALAIGAIRRMPPVGARIEAEQVKLLLSLGEASRLTIFGAILVVGAAFYQTAPIWATASSRPTSTTCACSSKVWTIAPTRPSPP